MPSDLAIIEGMGKLKDRYTKSFKSDLQKHVLRLGLLIIFLSTACQGKKDEVNEYEKLLSEAYSKGQFNGNALILENGEIAYQGSFGIGNIDPVDSLSLNSIFRIGSVSKQFTAMGIMILKEQGKLSYDQDIRDFIPELPYEGVTIQHLLNHVSGLPDYMNMMRKNWKPELASDDPNKLVSGNSDLIDMFVRTNPEIYFSPGEKWEYSNTGYVLLASIVSRASGMSFAEFLKQHIFDPAQMNNTSVYKYIPGKDSKMPLRVYGFSTEVNGIDRVSMDYHFLNGVSGDGGIYSTLEDLLKWDRILCSEKLVSKSTLEEAYTPTILNNGDTVNYGFGWRVGKSPASGKRAVWHSGGWVGFSSYIYRETEENNCIILLTNNSTRYFWSIVGPLENILHRQPYELPKLSIAEVMGKIIFDKGIDAAIEQYNNLKLNESDSYDFRERQLNQLGYQLLELDRVDDALVVLRLNTEEFPESPNTYDSFGDALLANGDTANSLINFKKALAMDSTLTATKEKIMKIEESLSDNS